MKTTLPNHDQAVASPDPILPRESLFRTLDEIYEDAFHNRQFTPVYLMMLVLAALIALLGLLLNSPAVIIGAMLISPLMWPILTCGLALNQADWHLGKKAGRNVLLSVGEAVVITTFAGLLSPLKEATPEILARISPNLMDLLVAFFSGAAGTLAWVSRTRGGLTILPGVAIATAVMPPLAATGFGIATAQWQIAGGAFMLFITNLTAIIVSADLVFFIIGFRPAQHAPEKHRMMLRYRFLAATLVLIILSIPLTHTLIRAAQQARMRSEINTTLRQRLEQAHPTRLTGLEFTAGRAAVVVDATVATPSLIQMAQVRELEAELARRLGRKVELHLHQVRLERNGERETAAAEALRERDFVAGGAVRPASRIQPEPPPVEQLSQVQSRIQFLLGWLVQPMEVDSLAVRAIGRQLDRTILIDIAARQAYPTDRDAWRAAAAALASELQAPVHIRGRIITRAADDHILRFPEGAASIAAADVRRVRQALQEWDQHDDIRLAFAPSPDAPARLTAQRLAALRRRFSQADSGDPMLAYDIAPDEVRFYLLQEVDVVGRLRTPPTTPTFEAMPGSTTAP